MKVGQSARNARNSFITEGLAGPDVRETAQANVSAPRLGARPPTPHHGDQSALAHGSSETVISSFELFLNKGNVKNVGGIVIMMDEILGGVDRLLRSFAHDIIRRRDGLSGWKVKRQEFQASLRKGPDHLRRDVEAKVRNILIHARETSPYYRNACKAMGPFGSSSFKLDDLQQFPLLTKDIIKQQRSSLLSERFQSRDLDMDLTSGTTGTRTQFYRNHECTVSRVGRQLGILELCGYRPGTRRALLWGVNSDLSTGGVRGLRQWFRSFADSQESLPCKVMSEQDMMAYHVRLRRFKPSVLYGYPKAMSQFGRFILDRKLQPIKVRTIISTAERLTPKQREFLRQVYGGEVFDLYCTREYGCIGFECKRHEGFHIDTESVFVEIVKDGRPVEPGESGEITITDLLNYGMPLIRSRTGDIGMLSPTSCECGSPLPLLKALDGRVPDNIYRPDGSIVAGVLLSYLFMDMPAIRAAQFVQENMKELDVFLEVNGEFSDELRKEALRQVRERMGSEIEVRFTPVLEILRNPLSGKYQDVISRISRNEGMNTGGSGV